MSVWQSNFWQFEKVNKFIKDIKLYKSYKVLESKSNSLTPYYYISFTRASHVNNFMKH